MSTSSLLRLEHVQKNYGKTEALSGVNLDIQPGRIVGLLGPNGSGKTTLCNVLRRFVPDFYKGELKGKITLEGKELKDYSAKEIVQKYIILVDFPTLRILSVLKRKCGFSWFLSHANSASVIFCFSSLNCLLSVLWRI